VTGNAINYKNKQGDNPICSTRAEISQPSRLISPRSAIAEHNIESKKTCKYVAPSSHKYSKQASFSTLVIIQLKIEILSEGVMTKNFIHKSLEFIQLLVCKRIAGVIFV